MTPTVSYANYEAARHVSAMLASEPRYVSSVDSDVWTAVLKVISSATSGLAGFAPSYGPTLPHIGSSSFIVDYRPPRPAQKPAEPEVSTEFRKVVALPVVDQLQALLAALSLNKSQLSQILRVTRPTLYDWFQGKEPNAANMERLHALLRIFARASVSGVDPLNARFVRQSMELDSPSIVDLLAAEELDENRIVRAIEQARALGHAANQRRLAREERLRALGFEEPNSEQRRKQLAKNVALKDWPYP